MSMELYLIHVGFIAALVFSVYRSGVKQGETKMINRLWTVTTKTNTVKRNRLMNEAIDLVDTKKSKTPL